MSIIDTEYTQPCIPALAFRDIVGRANKGEPKARAQMFRVLSPEQQIRALDRWGMPLNIPFDCHGEPIFA